MKTFRLLGFCLLIASSLSAAQPRQSLPLACGDLLTDGGEGTDYRQVRNKGSTNPEKFHFTPKVENLIAGQTAEQIGADIGFVLRYFPNHHRALVSMTRLAERERAEKAAGSLYTVECWYRRALYVAPDDHVARMLFAQYLGKSGRRDEAVAQLQIVEQFAEDNALTLNNLGLLYLEVGRPEQALALAQRAYALGLPNPKLRDALKAAGAWREVEATMSPASEVRP